MTPQEEALFNRARNKIEDQQNLLKRLTAPAYHVGTVVATYPDRVVVDTGNQLFELEKVESSLNLCVGQGVDIHPESGQIVKSSDFVSYGHTGTVTAIDDDLIQINLPSGVMSTPYSMVDVAVGDKVVMNSSNRVIMRKLKVDTKYAFKTQSVLTWDDIGACADAKKELIAAIETPFAQSALFKFFNKARIKGTLLWGRPGNGKTLLGRAAAGSLAKMHGKEAKETGFIYIKGPEILDKFVGEPEARINEAFDFGVAHFKKYGYPAILFVDEADAILIRRGMRTASGMEQTIVPMFNARMDGIEDSGVFVILATNRADILDPAIIRPGRIDRKIYVAPPTRENALEIWNIHMKKSPIAKNLTRDQLIEAANAALYSDQFPLYYIDTPKGRSTFTLGNLVSGAIIAGVVERASAIAIDRNVEAKKAASKNFAPEGLKQEDFSAALTAMHKEQHGMNHFDELREFIDFRKLDDITSIEACHDGQKIERPRTQQSTQTQVIAVPMPKKGEYDA